MQLRLLPVALLLATAFSPLAQAANTPSHQHIEATLDVAQPDVRNITIANALDIHRILILGFSQTAKGLSDSYRASDATGKAALVADLSAAVQTEFESALAQSFPTASRTVSTPVVDESSLAILHTDAELPPIHVSVTAALTRTAADVGFGGYSEAQVASLFAAGGVVRRDLTLSSDAGYDSTYIVHVPRAPTGLSFAAPSAGELSADGKTLTVLVANDQGTAATTQAVRVDVLDANSTPPKAESVESIIDISLGALRAGSPTFPITTHVVAALHAVDVGKRFPIAVPASVKLSFLSADGLRGLHQSGIINEKQLSSASDSLLAGIRQNLTAALGASTNVTGGWVEDDLHATVARPYQTDPPVRFAADATSEYTIPGAGAENADLALKLGALVTFDIHLFSSADRANTFTLHAPPGAVFTSATGASGVVGADGTSATFHTPIATTPGSVPVQLSMRAAGVPNYTAQVADLGITVDLKDIDVTLGKAIKGDFGNLDVDVLVSGKLNVIEVPPDVKKSFSSNLHLEYLSADGIRLLKQRGILTAANLTAIEDKLRSQIATNLKGALGSNADVTASLDAASLDPALIGSTPSADTPITFTAHSSFLKPLSGGASSGGAAIALYTVHQSFDLPKVQSLDTTYTVILPSGLAVKDLQVSGGEGKTGTAPDGRDQFTVKPTGSSAQTSVAMAVTPSFVLAKFWPVVLIAVILLILIVGTPVAIIVARRRKGKGA